MPFEIRRFKRPDYWIPLLCLLGLALSGTALFHHGEDHRDVNHARESLGYLRPLGADIRVMGDTEHTWSTVGREANVFNNDRVFTGEKSEAKVQLKNHQGFTVEPRSLVVISDEDKKSTINLDVGGFLTEMRSGVELLVRYKGHETKLKSSGAIVRLAANDGGTLRLEVLKGEASVMPTAARPEPQLIKANETLSIAPDQTTKLEVYSAELVSPAPGEVLWQTGKNVQFRWNTPNGRLLHMEVSEDPEFKNKIRLENELAGAAGAKLDPAAAYFWRVVDKNGGSVSNVSSFSLSRLVAPKIDATLADVRMTRDANGGLHQPLVKISWSDSIGSETFRVETSKDADFRTTRDANETQKTEAFVDNIAPGTLYWRVISKAPGRVELTSAVGALRIGVSETVIEQRAPAQAQTPPSAMLAATPSPESTPVPRPVVVVIAQAPLVLPAAVPTSTPVPLPIATPAASLLPPTTALATPKPFERFSNLEFSAGGDYLSLDGQEVANGTNAHLLSSLSPSVEARWRQHWTELFSTSLSVGYKKIQIESPDNDVVLLNENSTQTALGIGADYKFTQDLKLSLDLEHTQAMFYHAMQAGVLQIDEVPLLHVHPFLEWTFLRAPPFELRAHAGVSYWGASSFADYSVQSGTGYDLGLVIEQNFKSSSLSCSPTYAERKQNSTFLTESQRDLSIGCAFKVNLP